MNQRAGTSAGRRAMHDMPPLALLAAMAVSVLPLLGSPPVVAEVVFDGSIGPLAPGTTRSGAFAITEADGALRGNNLFHSFGVFSVNPGESATFSHATDGVRNIIGRVSGDKTTAIQGGVAVRQDVGGGQVPTAAVLWLINPSGIVIGDGAFFDHNSSFNLSTANQIGFDNGDAFFSHDVTQVSTLSVANPVAFGFLAGDSLPGSVSPAGIRVQISDPGNINAPLFLSDMTLVGTAPSGIDTGVTLQGDIGAPFVQDTVFAPADSSQFQAFRLAVHAIGPADTIDLSAPTLPPGAGGGSVVSIRDANVLVTDDGLPVDSGLLIGGSNVVIENAFIQAQAGLSPSDISLTAAGVVIVDASSVQTTTFGTSAAGDVQVSAAGLSIGDSVVASRVEDFDFGFTVGSAGSVSLDAAAIQLTGAQVYSLGPNVGTPGTVEIAAGGQGLFASDSSVFNGSNAGGAGGDIVIRADGDITLLTSGGSQGILTNTAGPSASGDIRIAAGGDLAVVGSFDISTNTSSSGNAGAIALAGANVDMVGDAGRIDLSSSTVGTGRAGRIDVTAQARLALTSVDIFSASGVDGAAGGVALEGASVALLDSNVFTSTLSNDPGDLPAAIALTASDSVSIEASTIQSNTGGAAPAGRIAITSGGSVRMDQVNLQSASLADGLAGDIVVRAADDLTLSGDRSLVLTNAIGSSDAGNIQFAAANIALVGGPTIQTTSSGSGDAGTIRLTGGRIYTDSARVESASENAGGGDIDLFAAEILLDGDARTGDIVFLFADSFSSDPLGNGGSITLGDPSNPARTIVVRSSALSASAQQGDGGRININSAAFIRDAGSVFLVTSVSGDPGELEINAPEQDISAAIVELDVPLLDQTELISNVCDRGSGERSSLIVIPVDASQDAPDQYLQIPAVQTDGAGTRPTPVSGSPAGRPGRLIAMQVECSR
jgi:filamentous hemagglutinin family protein